MFCQDCKVSAKCVTINCHFPKFPKKRAATITIKSRLWNSTLVEDYSQVDWVRIVSYAGVTILDPTVKQDDISNDVAMVSMEQKIKLSSYIHYYFMLSEIEN